MKRLVNPKSIEPPAFKRNFDASLQRDRYRAALITARARAADA